MSIVNGTTANDQLNGTAGNDTLYGYGGADILRGQAGVDRLFGGDGNDTLYGAAGNDTLQGGTGNDFLQGDTGDDRLVGEDGDDRLYGGDGFDFLIGSLGNDTIYGGAANDTVQGGDGADWIYGDAGDDFLIGNAGADTFVLGSGLDTVNDFSASQGDVIDLGSMLASYTPGTDALADFVRVTRNPGTTTVTVAIDANGMKDGVAAFQNAGLVKNANYTDLTAMLNAGVLLVPSAPGEPADGFTGTSGAVSKFEDFLGINVKIDTSHASYGSAAKINSGLDYLNIKNIRVGAEAPVNNKITAPIYDALAENEINFDFLMRREFPTKGDALIDQYVAHFKAFLKEHPGSIKALEGVNEIGDTSWTMSYDGMTGKAAAVAYQKALYQAFNADAALKDIPLYNFTVHKSYEDANMTGYGDMSNYSDAANAHVYINVKTFHYYELMNRIEDVKALDTNSPAVITEMGYPSNALKGNILSVDQTAQAKLLLNGIMNAYEQGVESAYIYELFDARTNAQTDNKANFGLFSVNGVAKVAAKVVHNLTEVLYRDTGTGPVDPVGYDLRNEDSNTHAVSMEKSGGVTDIVVWREGLVWNHLTAKPIAVASESIQIALDATAKYVDVYDPLAGTSVQQRFTNTDLVTVNVADHPIILEVGL